MKENSSTTGGTDCISFSEQILDIHIYIYHVQHMIFPSQLLNGVSYLLTSTAYWLVSLSHGRLLADICILLFILQHTWHFKRTLKKNDTLEKEKEAPGFDERKS